ncbi:Uncharacterised protein [Salmonella enterica subsp. enterica]|uniref:Uncharacterized protein n=1 Tax=Salmonella enterica I TaxID=59201 RepID=A0A447N9N1_SALET|nr:Uncharacterised protein [Salmonella enterica subsp. enterica]
MVNSNFSTLFEISLKLYPTPGPVCHAIFPPLSPAGDVLKPHGNEVPEDFEHSPGPNWQIKESNGTGPTVQYTSWCKVRLIPTRDTGTDSKYDSDALSTRQIKVL